MKKKTAGQIASELSTRQVESRDPIEIQRETTKDYESNVLEAIDRGKKAYGSDFYVVVTSKMEKLLTTGNTLFQRNYFFFRKTCPTPEYDQIVYRYYFKDDICEFLWTVPAKDACIYLREHALEVAPDERDLLQFVLDFYDDTLLRLSKKLNSECVNSPILIEQ